MACPHLAFHLDILSPGPDKDQVQAPARCPASQPTSSPPYAHYELPPADYLPTARALEATYPLLTILGGPLAVLLQFAQPGIALGTCAHSRFALDPVKRLRRTVAYLNAVIHGSPADRATIVGQINRQHARVKGRGYEANDAALQMWTAATVYMASVKVYETFVGRANEDWGLDRAVKEGLCRDMAAVATSLRMPAEMWPATLVEFETYWDGVIDGLEVSEASKRTAQQFLYQMAVPWFLVCLVPVMRAVVTTWLPEKLRAAYGLPDPATWWVWLLYRAFVGVVSLAFFLIPTPVWLFLHELLLADMRQAAADIRRTGRWTI